MAGPSHGLSAGSPPKNCAAVRRVTRRARPVGPMGPAASFSSNLINLVEVLGVSGGVVGHGLGYLQPLQRILITRLRLALGVPRPEQDGEPSMSLAGRRRYLWAHETPSAFGRWRISGPCALHARLARWRESLC